MKGGAVRRLTKSEGIRKQACASPRQDPKGLRSSPLHFSAFVNRGLRGYHLRTALMPLIYANTENEVVKIWRAATMGRRFDHWRCRRLAFRPFPRQTKTYSAWTRRFIRDGQAGLRGAR
jgi:hypothetical protein